MASKSKSGLTEASNNKATPPTPKANSKSSKGCGSHKSVSNPKSSPNEKKSPISNDLKPPVDRRSAKATPKTTTPLEKKPTNLKSPDLQAQLAALKEELNKTNDQLFLAEREKTQALDELQESKRQTEETKQKLEEFEEIKKSRAVELEQSTVEVARKKEEEWREKFEEIQKQQEIDRVTLLSTREQLEIVKTELSRAIDARNSAITHADDSMRLAEDNIEKANLISNELDRLKELYNTEIEKKEREKEEVVQKFESEFVVLKDQVEKSKESDKKLVRMENLIQRLRTQIDNAKKSESDLSKVVAELKEKSEILERNLNEVNESNKLKGDSIGSALQELEAKNALLKEKEIEISSLREKTEYLEMEMAKQKEETELSTQSLLASEKEMLELKSTVGDLKLKLQTVEEAKTEALNSENLACSTIETLTTEKSELIKELEISKEEGQKIKKAMDDLASALHEVSTEARESQEKFLLKQEELERAHCQIEELNLCLRNTKENYEVMLDEANYERVCLQKSVERLETEANGWNEKELGFLSSIKKSEEDITAVKVERDKAVESLKETEKELETKKEESAQLQNKLKQFETKLEQVNEELEEAKAETLRLKEELEKKERELQSVIQENGEVKDRETSALEKIKELDGLIGEKDSTEKECNNNGLEENGKENNNALEEPVVIVEKMLEGGKIVDYLSNERETNERESKDESVDDDLESSVEDGVSEKVINNGNGNGNGKQNELQKKSKPLFKKFGGLLKKKSNT